MTKEQKRTSAFLKKHIPEMQNFLNLNDWEITTSIVDGVHSENKSVAMTCEIDLSYLKAIITAFNPVHTCDDDYIVHTIMHELCHIITEPQYSLCRGHASQILHPFIEEMREQETERIARIAMKGYKQI